MSFPAYPSYRHSGVAWIGDVPSSWQVVPLKHVVSMQSGEQITAERIEDAGDYPVFGGNGLRGYTTSYTHQGDYALIGRQGALWRPLRNALLIVPDADSLGPSE